MTDAVAPSGGNGSQFAVDNVHDLAVLLARVDYRRIANGTAVGGLAAAFGEYYRPVEHGCIPASALFAGDDLRLAGGDDGVDVIKPFGHVSASHILIMRL